MKGRDRKKLLAAVCVATSLLSFACLSDQRRGLPHAIGNQLAANAVNYNLAIEKSQNEVLLLNIVRAMQHRPLYLTDASKITGTINGTFTIGLTLPWGRGSDGGPEPEKPSIAPSVMYSTSPAMDVNLLDSQDFVAGFLKPIPPKLFTYYWDQGWPAEFLLHMLVLRVDEYDQGPEGKFRLTATYVNHPMAGKTAEIEAFSSWVRSIVSGGRPWTKPPANPYQTKLEVVSRDVAEKNAILANLDSIAKDQGFTFSPFDDYLGQNPLDEEIKPFKPPQNEPRMRRWTLATTDEIRTLVYPSPNATLSAPGPASAPLGDTKLRPRSDIGETAAFNSRVLVIPSNMPEKADAPKHAPIFVMTLRSPEGLLFYLGELASMENPQEKITTREAKSKILLIHAWDKNGHTTPLVPLFSVKSGAGSGACKSIVSIRSLQDAEFFVPAAGPSEAPIEDSPAKVVIDSPGVCQSGESMHALSLLSQLIGLQKSAKDFPTTTTVKVVGQ